MAVFPRLMALAPELRAAKRVWVAYSGGLDSTVLLHQVAQLELPDLRAMHVNHQISPNANNWQRHCEQTAKDLGIELVVETVSVEDTGKGLEEAARNQRYQVFAKHLSIGDVMLSAHHANDQAETLLFRLMRGAGLKGLCGVPATRLIGRKTQLLRPFLGVSRAELEIWASKHKISWVEDESNDDTGIDRNYIRHQVIPNLLSRWPNAIDQIANSASLLADSQQLLDAYLEEDLKACKLRRERVGESITLNVFLNFDAIRQNHLLRYWIARRELLLPAQQHLVEIHKLLNSAPDAKPEVSWGPVGKCAGGGSFFRYQNRLYLGCRLNYALDQDAIYQKWDGVSKLTLGNFSLAGKAAKQGLQQADYHILFREGGERCQPAQRDNSQTLKKLLQEYRLEPWLRDSVPLIFRGQQLAAVGDLWICDGFVAEGGFQPVWRIE